MQQQLERLIPGYNRNASVAAPSAGALRVAAQNYTIPIVFHVVHNGEAVGTGTNISDARIMEQFNRLNEDFGMQNADRTLVPSAFQPLHADMQIQFAMAQRDPNGNCINGINRINRNTKGWTAPPYTQTYCNTTIKPGSFWDPTKYLNFWVVDLGGGLLGFAQFPDNTANLGGLNASGGSASTDGVVCLYSSVGNAGPSAAPYNLGRTATHEVGHWLGLRHIWGDGGTQPGQPAPCSAGASDHVSDTPLQSAANYGCPSFPSRTCGNTTNGDMFMNYMDYTDDACMFMFSAGQKDRMQAVMAANTPRRTSLATSPALPSAARVVASTLTPLVCEGSTILLNGDAPNGYTYSWTGPNNFSSSQQNPSLTNVTSAAAGTYTLTATPTGGCPMSSTVEVAVRPLTATPSVSASNGGLSCGNAAVVLTAVPAGVQSSTLSNQTWNANSTEANWTYDDTSTSMQAGDVWSIVTPTATGGFNGTRYIAVDASATNRNAQTRTSLYSPTINASSVSSLTLSFQHAFTYVTGDLGKLEVSVNGGGSWTTVQNYNATSGTLAAPATVTINLNTYAGQSNLKLRWNYSSNAGGSWAVENIMLTGNVAHTYAWSLVSGNGMPVTLTSSNTLLVTPSQNSVYQVTVTAPGKCASAGATVSVTVPTATTWTGGAGNGNWDNASNWNPCVPTRTTTATIPNGLATPYPIISSTVEVLNLVQNGPVTLSSGSLSLYGSHTGTGPFTHSGGSFVVAGTGLQDLRGLNYRTLTLNGSGQKMLRGDATASGTVALTGGMLVTGTNVLTLNTGSSLTETTSSYILGRVLTVMTPIAGSTTSFRGIGASIAVPAGGMSPGATTALRVTGDRLTDASAAGFQSISRYFDLTPTVNTGLNITVTLGYNATNDLGDITESRLAAFRAVNANGPFERMRSTLDMTAGTCTIANVDHLSVWTLAGANAPLPVSLSSFEVAAAGADAQLSWATASEKNNAHFNVEASTDGRKFNSIAQVAGAGNSAQRQQYSYTDAGIARYGATKLYYRLRQVDTDGTVSYSPVRTLGVAKGFATGLSALLWPNPSAASSTAPSLELRHYGAEPVTLTLRDALGRVRCVRTVAPTADGIALTEAASLRAGLYILEVQQGHQRISLKLLRD